MAKLDKLFRICLHCSHAAAQPVYTCPACDWPRAHSEATPEPDLGMADQSWKPGETIKIQAHAANQPLQLVDIAIAPNAAPQAAQLAVIPDAPPVAVAPLRTLQLAPDDPVADVDIPVVVPVPQAPAMIPKEESMEELLAKLSSSPPTPKRKK